MQAIYSEKTVSITEFKKNPTAVLRGAKNKPVAVLSHNKTSFYMVQPAVFEAIMEELADRDLTHKVLARLEERSRAIEVDVEKI